MLETPPLTLTLDPQDHCWSPVMGRRHLRLRNDIAAWCQENLKPGWEFEIQDLLLPVAVMKANEPPGVWITMPTIRFADDTDMVFFKMMWWS